MIKIGASKSSGRAVGKLYISLPSKRAITQAYKARTPSPVNWQKVLMMARQKSNGIKGL
jgi:hypothetical protein